jgi:hypothetical protein
MIRRSLACAALALSVQGAAVSGASATVTFVINNLDGPGEGFNDPTPVAPVPGNPGTTLGEQRLNAFQAAADAWGQILNSAVTIAVDAQMSPLPCDAVSALLGQAGPTLAFRDFPSAPRAATWFSVALANSLAGSDQAPGVGDIGAAFNSDIDSNPNCLTGVTWWYGIGAPPAPGTIPFFDVVQHEIAHGLGFLTFVDLATGQKLLGFDDIDMTFLEDHSTGMSWPALTDPGRMASAVDTGDLHWTGSQANDCAAAILTAGFEEGHTRMYAPNLLQPGSSVSHWDTVLTPNELMEPFATLDPDHRLTDRLLADTGWTVESEPCAAVVAVDIRPRQCPNRLRVDARGNLPVAIAGTDDLDASEIDPDSVRLAGVRPKAPRTRLRDVATPFEPFVGKVDATDCTRAGADGWEDLLMRFSNRRVVKALGPVADGEVVVVPLTGELYNGTPIVGEDVVVVIDPDARDKARLAAQLLTGADEVE